MSLRFRGFSSEALSFFRSLEKNNRREWFQPRKEIFDREVKEPMLALVEELAGEMRRFAPDYVPPDPKKTLYRIYRDTRFSEDKTPYKTHIAAHFQHQAVNKNAGGGLYFSVSHKEIEVAGGVYMPGPEELLAIRTHLAENYAGFHKIIDGKTLRKLVGELRGESLTRVPKGFAADHAAADLVKRKQWYFYVLLEPDIACTPRIVKEVLKRFETMTPLVDFLNAPIVARKRKSAAAFLM